MLRKSIFIAVCITFLATAHSYAITATDVTDLTNKEASVKETSAQQASKQTDVVRRSGVTILNIILTGIDNNYVYAEDGRTFPISPHTRIIKNLGGSRIRIAELVFRGDTLISVHIK